MLVAPTKTQTKALGVLREHGTLERWPGGFWTYPSCPVDHVTNGCDIPSWYVTTHTVQAMERRGWLERVGKYPESYRDDRRLTDDGRALAAPPARLRDRDGSIWTTVPGTPFVEDEHGERYTRAWVEERAGSLTSAEGRSDADLRR